jgi:hypothetical protein
METRDPASVFDPAWFAVALEALAGPIDHEPLIVSVETPEGSVRLRVGRAVRLADADAVATVAVRGPVAVILGLASGQLSADEAGAMLEIAGAPNEADAVRDWLLAGGARALT